MKNRLLHIYWVFNKRACKIQLSKSLQLLENSAQRKGEFVRQTILLLGIAFCFLQSGCYSFRGVSIDPNTKTYSVALFTNSTPAAPPTIAQQFTEKLKDKIRNNTRLSLVNTEGSDLSFSGQVVGYDVTALAPQPGQNAAFNQLRITIEVELVDNKNEKGSWKQPFTFQADFPGSGQLLTFQDQLIKTISDKILEDIFNKAFTENW